jgi:hypothetical protein
LSTWALITEYRVLGIKILTIHYHTTKKVAIADWFYGISPLDKTGRENSSVLLTSVDELGNSFRVV